MIYEYDIRATKKLWYSCIQDYNKYLQEDIENVRKDDCSKMTNVDIEIIKDYEDKNGGYSVTLEINGTIAVTSKEELDNICFGSLEDVKNV